MEGERLSINARQYRWLTAYNQNPELAMTLIPLFDMDDEEIEFVIRIINSLRDGLRFYNSDVKYITTMSSKKKRNNKTPVSTLVPQTVEASVVGGIT